MPKLTILTATYNRADCLTDCWNSLKAQTCSDFQWLIVDDGSTDNTADLVAEFIKSSPEMQIDYVYKPNGGKHTALNASHPHIQGDYVLTLDSDDRLIPTAVEDVLSAWARYDAHEEVGQIIFLKGYSEDVPICYVNHEDTIVDVLEEPRIGTAGHDCCDCFRTELFIKHPFPEFPNERFLGEGAAFFFIQLESRGVYINKVVYLCDYREDGLTKAGKKMRLLNPLGGRYNSMVYMHPRLSMKTRIKKGVLYTCYSRFAHIGLRQELKDNRYTCLTLLTYPFGVALYFYWKKKYLGNKE